MAGSFVATLKPCP